ncbi:MAG: electron transport complex subunit RsxC [Clostridia bacterium]|nr:electron transport complex subunit RsxC [Clostridia bacterium]
MSILKAKKTSHGSRIHGTKISNNSPIESIPTPNVVYISTSQHIGSPAIPIVKIGDKVKKGQLIASESGFVSANIYSSISGTVVNITDLINGMGQNQKYIVIENDNLNEEMILDPLPDKEPQTVINRIRIAGIVGLGGAGFPTAVKLSPKSSIDTLVVNGAECEPYLTCDYRLMIERTDDIYKGIKIVADALKVKHIVIGIEINKPLAIEAFSKFSDLDVVVLKKRYPMGSEKHLIYATTGRKVAPGKMPFDVSCCVQNIKTLLACYEAVELNKPLTENIITVSGKGITEPKNLKVPFGTPYSDLIDYCKGLTEDAVKIIAGGPMMGKCLINLNQYTRKTDCGILCLKPNEINADEPSNCINCGTCIKRCPMHLSPVYIESFSLSGDYVNAEKYGALNCIECGLCSYNCPAKRALVQSIQIAKTKIKEMKNNATK